jgi:hypothetical protein
MFFLSFLEIKKLVVEETNTYYHQYLDMLDERRCPQSDVTIHEMCFFLAIILQIKFMIRTAGYSLLDHMRNKHILDKLKVTSITVNVNN